MPEATTDAYPLAFEGPIDLRFTPRSSVVLEVRFYSDLAGTVAIDASAGGDRLVSPQLIRRVHYDEPDRDDVLYSSIAFPIGPPLLFSGSTADILNLGSGRGEVRITTSGGTPPVGALSYRLVYQ